MRSEEKRLIIILVIITIVVIGGLAIWKGRQKEEMDQGRLNETTQGGEKIEEVYVQNMQDGSKVNISDEIRKTKTLDGLEITNIKLKEKGGLSTLLADVENKTGRTSEEKLIKVEILDKTGKVMAELRGVIDRMEAGEKVELNINATVDVANAYDFRISNV